MLVSVLYVTIKVRQRDDALRIIKNKFPTQKPIEFSKTVKRVWKTVFLSILHWKFPAQIYFWHKFKLFRHFKYFALELYFPPPTTTIDCSQSGYSTENEQFTQFRL